MHRILFVFLDGVGLAPSGPENPFARHDGTALRELGGGSRWTQALSETTRSHHLVRSLDATLGVEGLPQSGTGQATLFTGVNCASLVGRHFGPFPHSATYEILDHDNVFHCVQALTAAPDPAAFANAFPPPFFTASRRRGTVTTRCCAGADVPLRDLDALRNERAIPADLTAETWRETLALDVPRRTEADTARVLAQTHRQHALTLFEYFLTDKVGHGRTDRSPSALLDGLDRFLGTLLEHLDPETESLLVTSDHGNLETTRHTQHTRNPVPLIVRGWAAPYFTDAQDLTDVTPGIIDALRSANGALRGASDSPPSSSNPATPTQTDASPS